jgi:glycosyltransferase involved in cell wall biosynthesis
VQELCEWWPGEPTCSAFTKWLYRKQLFKNATGVLVISKLIEERVRVAAAAVNPSLRVHRLPSVVDLKHFEDVSSSVNRFSPREPFFLWCGAIDDWHRDVLFLIRAMRLVRDAGHHSTLVIVGTCSLSCQDLITDYARQHGFSPEEVMLTGYVDSQSLQALYRSAAGLLLPLRDDDRSRTRMPNKLAEYLASGRPVVTCTVGDLTGLLRDGVNSYLAKPGDERCFAEKMLSVLNDPALADRIGTAGRQACADHLDYRTHVRGLAEFFRSCTS